MKRIVLAVITVLCGLITQAQEVMVIEKSDGTTVRMSVDEVKRVLFERAFQGEIAEAVDLGLPSGTKWASWNLGASEPLEYGGYFGWGDVTGEKTSTDLDDYPNANPPMEISGTQYDPAKAQWGGQWRMPTFVDFLELGACCSFYLNDNGDICVKGPNGNQIYFPWAGFREDNTSNKDGFYWSGTRDTDSERALVTEYDKEESAIGAYAVYRYLGLSIRPVYGTLNKLSLYTYIPNEITETTATLRGFVTTNETSISYTLGFFISKSGTPSIYNYTKKIISNSKSVGLYSAEVTGLESDTKYYVRAYALCDGQYYYGLEKEFSTLADQSTKHNGHEFVDLGLPSGMKWASCNVGASKPEEYGNYYAWGETTTKTTYTWDNYKWGDFWNNNLTKYNIDSAYGKVDNKTVLELADDAANVNWGGKWRMPTLEELNELLAWSSLEATTQNGVAGYKFTSKMNQNSIFLPSGGWKYESELNAKGADAWYRTSSLMVLDKQMDSSYSLYSDKIDWGDRSWGMLIRPVFKE